MFALCLVACFAVFAPVIQGGLVGPITITENGQPVTRYVVSTYPPMVKVSGNAIILEHNSQAQIASSAANNYSAHIFQEYKLQGKTVAFTANLSTVGCSCNAALYFSSMPGMGSNGQPNPGDAGDYYCDANDVNKEWCWELDVMEANRYVTAATPHTCSQPPGTYITNCDRGGCGTNGYNVNSKGMCPDSSCKINTQQPFRQAMQMTGSSMHVTLTQGSNTFDFDVCGNSGYISNMNQALDYGMTLILSHWGGTYSTMQWLDGKTGCSGDCTGSNVGLAIFSDFNIS